MLRDFLRVLGVAATAVLIYFVINALSGGPRRPPSFQTAQRSRTVTSYTVVTDALASAQSFANRAPKQAEEGGRRLPQTDETVLAKVDGEPLCFGQIRAGIPGEYFGSVLENAVAARLERLIHDKAIDFYLRTKGVEVPQTEVDRAVADMRENPPALGTCICCRYGSLDEYLSANCLTLDDLKMEIRNDMGVSRHVDALWDTEYGTDEKRCALLAQQRPRLEKTYINLSHIFFNTMPQSAYDGSVEKVRRRAEKRMHAAWDKLKAGQSFETVVGDSEDSLSRADGGRLGCVPMNLFGFDVEQQLRKLPTGTIGDPIESPWGFHFFRREPVSDADWLATLKKENKDRRTAALYDTIMKTAQIERFNVLPN